MSSYLLWEYSLSRGQECTCMNSSDIGTIVGKQFNYQMEAEDEHPLNIELVIKYHNKHNCEDIDEDDLLKDLIMLMVAGYKGYIICINLETYALVHYNINIWEKRIEVSSVLTRPDTEHSVWVNPSDKKYSHLLPDSHTLNIIPVIPVVLDLGSASSNQSNKTVQKLMSEYNGYKLYLDNVQLNEVLNDSAVCDR